MRILFTFIIVVITSVCAHSQLMVAKMIGKNSKNTKLGYGAFVGYELPVNETGNNSVRLELLDFAYFPAKDENQTSLLGYVSIKAGFKHTFSESRTGFYIEPQAGYCRTVLNDPDYVDAIPGDGVALALEGGYSLEVGQHGNTLIFGLKYEHDISKPESTLSSIGFRIAYSYGMFKRRS